MRFNGLHQIQNQQHDGSALVLVVAVLALLAVIGTVYIVSSRMERSSAAAASVAFNLKLAEESVNNMAINAIAEANMDANGVVGGYESTGPLGTQAARRWDIPEINLTLDPTTIGKADHNAAHRDQAWLASSLYVGGDYGQEKPDGSHVRYNQMSLLTNSLFNPSTGAYDLPIYMTTTTPDASWRSTPYPYVQYFDVVAPNLQTMVGVPHTDGTITPGQHDAFVQLLPFSEASGVRYRFGVRILDTSSMANLNVGGTYNFADVNQWTTPRLHGTYHTGYNLCAPDMFGDGSGPYLMGNDVPASLQVTWFGDPRNPGRWGSWMPAGAINNFQLPYAPLEYYWQQAVFRFEHRTYRYVQHFTSVIYLGPDPDSTPLEDTKVFPIDVTPFDLSDELELRSYGALGTMYTSRTAMVSPDVRVWPNVLGNREPYTPNVVGNLRRQFYTTYSYSRDLRPYADPVNSYTVTGPYDTDYSLPAVDSTHRYYWPPFPAKVNANPEIMSYSRIWNTAGRELVLAATCLAKAMEMSGYSGQEARAFAANYLTYRCSGWKVVRQETYRGSKVNVWSMPLGPSFIDKRGMCLRTSSVPECMDWGYLRLKVYPNRDVPRYYEWYPSDLRSEADNKVYLGYAGQPFINELAVQFDPDGAGGAAISDSAIELYNPYNVALSLDDYCLMVKGEEVPVFAGKGYWIPPRGYFVLTTKAGVLDKRIKNDDAQKQHDAAFTLEGATKVYLMRKYVEREKRGENVFYSGPFSLEYSAVKYAAIDAYDATQVVAAPATAPEDPEVHFVARSNDELSPVAPSDATYAKYRDYEKRWIATVHNPLTVEVAHVNDDKTPNRLSLGDRNDNDQTVIHSIPLYDRVLEMNEPDPLKFDVRMPLRNIADFNRIMRVGHELDLDNRGVPDGKSLAQQLCDRIFAPNAEVATCVMPWEAGVHFDFFAPPQLYAGNIGPGADPYPRTDRRALRLLDLITFTDRVSDSTNDYGASNNRGIRKLRIAGQINVNTASAEVLSAIPALYANPKFIGVIMAYRWRTSTLDPRIPEAVRLQTAMDFTDPVVYPGYGIRSLSELQAVIAAVNENAGVKHTTLDGRDTFWAALYNYLTVRSDTFVMYAYLEALRVNPRYSGTFNNTTDWYSPTAVSENPNDTSLPLQLVGKKRWITILDRSDANFNRLYNDNGTLLPSPLYRRPVVAVSKDLPK